MQSLKIKNFESQKKEIKDFDSIELKHIFAKSVLVYK